MNQSKLRWGILGTAGIARKNWKAIHNASNSTVVAVASRDAGRASRFITDCQAQVPFENTPSACGSYAELLARGDVEAVYIPLPTGLRKEWVMRAAQAGKHVVCEKPCAVSVADLREMLEVCRHYSVQFLDGVMFTHSRRLERIREVLDDGASVGKIRHIASAFSFGAPDNFFTDNIRAHSELEPHGCLGDLGWYCIRFALWAMNWRFPSRVTGRILSELGRVDSPAPVPTEFSGELLFNDGVSASFYCSFITGNQQWVNVSGTTGNLHVSDFVNPFCGSELEFEVRNAAFEKKGCDFTMQPNLRRVVVAEHGNSHPTAQETNLFRNFADQVRSGRLNDIWPEMALKTQRVMDACLNSARANSQPVELR